VARLGAISWAATQAASGLPAFAKLFGDEADEDDEHSYIQLQADIQNMQETPANPEELKG